MMNIRVLVFLFCLILGVFSGSARAQTTSQDSNDWLEFQADSNIFALREALESHLEISDGVRALAVAYIGAFSRDFEIAAQRLDYARRYANAHQDAIFAQHVDHVEAILLRERGDFQTLASRFERDGIAGQALKQRIAFWAQMQTMSVIDDQQFSLDNISPDDARVILAVSFGDASGTMLVDSGAEGSLLSPEFAEKYGAMGSDINFSMLTIDGPRWTELATIPNLAFGAAQFDEIPVGIQNQVDGVIGFFLNQGATGIMGFPILSRFGRIDFHVEASRVNSLTFHRPRDQVRKGKNPNIMIREEKPYLRIKLEGQTYSCIFDTGAPRSLFSSKIIDRHKTALAIDVLSDKDVRERSLGGRGKAEYIDALTFRAGHREIVLDNVHMVEASPADSEFCLIGMDAVINAGGARFDIDNLHLFFGPVEARSQAFNLR